MKRFRLAPALFWLSLGATALAQSCFVNAPLDPGPPGANNAGSSSLGGADGTPGAGGDGPQCVPPRPAEAGAECRPVVTSEPLRARLIKNEPVDTTMFTNDLFGMFNANCGGCHVASNLGDPPFNATSQTFSQNVDEESLERIMSDDPELVMPPLDAGGVLWKDRGEEDGVRIFASLLDTWLKQERPQDLFLVDASLNPNQDGPYAIDDEFGKTFTNLGTCLPDPGMVATEGEKSCELDAMFAGLEADPNAGSLVGKIGLPQRLDATDLFTLDSAELARYGVIAYVPTYPLWTDDAGKLRHVRVPMGQAIEYNRETKQLDIPPNTRFYKTFLKKIIDEDGSERFQKMETRLIVSRPNGESLFGTYAWNVNETEALLVTDPLRSGEPWLDRIVTLTVDWPKQREVEAKKPRNIRYALDDAHALRRYAIPGRERCIQCHMGTPDNNFILGFTPLQVNRLPKGQSGVLEDPTEDELSQLQRLIDYGVIKNFDPATDAITLESSQGDRAPRNEAEVTAQGYMLGNCAHCHNPNGYPSVENPELKELLDFLPSATGGIFQFPLERYSPRIARDVDGSRKIAYITPSLRDVHLTTDQNLASYKPKGSGQDTDFVFIDAPWRSLIYRNVDTPFTYGDDYAIFPHMPLNTSGFDCRAPRILGEWMVSIVAKKKDPGLNEDLLISNPASETDPQPYVEVKPGEPGYTNALLEAQKRLERYKSGPRFTDYCPDTTDIVDRGVIEGQRITPLDGTVLGFPVEGVPDRPHYVVTDLSEVPPPWNPRRTEWESVLVEGKLPALTVPVTDSIRYPPAKRAWDAENEVVQALKGLKLSAELKAFSDRQLPFALWEQKPNCNLDAQPKVGSYQGSDRPHWMDAANFMPTAPVYETVPGAAIYSMICVNCHGPNADSRGRQATTLQELTGGLGRVANFRDGLFGPPGSQGENRQRVFKDYDLAATYMPWMALGGTKVQIPRVILNLVSNTQVAGAKRKGGVAYVKTIENASANMLQVAQALCLETLPLPSSARTLLFDERYPDRLDNATFTVSTGLVFTNGDAELWQKLCIIDNPSPVRVMSLVGENLQFLPSSFYRADNYPANAPVGNFGKVDPALTRDNGFPWCLLDTPEAAAYSVAHQRNGRPLPLCPQGFVVEENRMITDIQDGGYRDDFRKWAGRGAINAGLAVFLFLDGIVGSDRPMPPRFNECEQLAP